MFLILSKEHSLSHALVSDYQHPIKIPVLYSELLNEVHRLTTEILKGGDYLFYNKARRGALYVKLGMFKDARVDLDRFD